MTPVEKIVREMIANQGPMSLAAYMELALQHPEYGYYRVREPLGRTGDFITAPEISQMFGEMIGVWCAEAWRMLGKPDPFALVELGPGRGTMMRDILRATAHVGGFHAALNLCLIDSNEVLRQKQKEILGDHAPHYYDGVTSLPAMPSIIIANEFFDSLPVRQFEKTFRGWGERKVIVDQKALATALVPLSQGEETFIPLSAREAMPGLIVEISPQSQQIMRDVAQHIVAHNGTALIIDYGYGTASGRATIQAISRHQYADILERPGELDLTAHVDFTALRQVACDAGVEVSPVIGQGEFLLNLGIDIRADSLKKKATPQQAAEIHTALTRLTDEAEMGGLFKVMEMSHYKIEN